MLMTRKMNGSQIFRLGSRRRRSVTALVCAIFAFLALTFLATGVQATIIFDNFDSGGGFSDQSYGFAAYAFYDGDAIPGSVWYYNAYRSAVEFTVTGGDFNLSSITLPIFFADSDNTLRVRLTADSSGLPGATLEVLSENQNIWPGIVYPATTTTTLTSVANPLLSHGEHYWIVTELTSFTPLGNESVNYYWFMNTSGTHVPLVQQEEVIFMLLPEDPWPSTLYYADNAFRVEGTPVPIPAPFWLFGSGLLGLVGWRRFKKN